MIEVLRGRYNRDMDFKDTVDLAASCVWMNISAENIRIIPQ